MDTIDPQMLAEKLAKSESRIYVDRLEALKTNFFVFDRNYQDLIKMVNTENRQKEMFELWDLKNRRLLTESINEVLRLLHNYLASAQSLVSQTRVKIYKWYEGKTFISEYQTQVDNRFKNNPLAGFIQDLRDYNLHYSLPVSKATFTINQIQEQSNKISLSYSYILIKSDLLSWNRWNGRSKIFLKTADDNIDIYALVDKYYKLASEFHIWLFTRISEVHRKELDWYKSQSELIISKMDDQEKRDRGLI